MIPTKAYILATKNPISIDYAKECSKSCDKIGLKWEYVNGYEGLTQEQVWKNFDYKVNDLMKNEAACATSHFNIWKKILDNKECSVILEHDALMLHKIDIEIPDNKIVALGYKFSDPNVYDSEKAGPPKDIIDIKRHSGAHAYTITYKTAELLLNELKEKGVNRAIDNYYFMRINQPEDRESIVPLAIMSPTPAICWLRKSTIWIEPSTLNYDIIESFKSNLKV